jgi:PAS domain S-box-containing protein
MNKKAPTRRDVKRQVLPSSTVNEVTESIKDPGSSGGYLQAIIDSLEDELMVIDRDFRIVVANKSVLARHGKRAQGVIGRYCYEISHGFNEPCYSLSHDCPIRKVWATGKPAQVTHVHVYHVRGRELERYLHITASPIKDSEGNVTLVASVMRDVTETRELESRVSKAHQDLLALNAIASVVSQSLDLDTVLDGALDKTLEIMQRSTGGILLLDEERQLLRYQAHRGLSKKNAQEMFFKLGEGIAGRVAQTGVAILADDISKDSRATHLDLITGDGIRALASVPLRSKQGVLGVLNIASHEPRKFSSGDIQLLDNIAAQIAIAVENIKLHQEVRSKEKIRGELLQDIFTIQEEERRRIARELHDETSQALASLSASLEAVSGMLPPDTDEVSVMLKKAQNVSINLLDEVQRWRESRSTSRPPEM